jgi:serine/threonine-protein kinase
LTIVLAAVFFGAFFGLQAIAEAILGSEQMGIAATISAAVVFGLFVPTRDRLRRFVDRRFYGIKVDYDRAPPEHAAQVDARQHRIVGRTQFGNYTDLELLGRGGMAEVYRGHHRTSNGDVAIKILSERLVDDESVRKRFYREAQTIARLKHPNVVQVHDVRDLNGIPYMVMEYIEGQDLGDLLRERGRLPLHEALPLLQEIASALDYAHHHGVVHRDIKPSNVMVAQESASGAGRSYRAVLMDFGLAKLYAALTQLTETERILGTLGYIAPEQIKGASEVDRRADLYSFGVMTYEILTGQLPFKHNNPGALVMAHLVQVPPDPRELVPDLPREVAEAIMRAMAKDPDARYATVGEFVHRLEFAPSLHRSRTEVTND